MTAVTYRSPRLIPPRRPRNRTRAGMPKPKPSPPPLIDADLHAESFRQVSEAHRVELVEDYVELISALSREGGEARQVDIAARLGVDQPTVAKMLKRLVKAGYVVQKPYRGTFLTTEGEDLAQSCRDANQSGDHFLPA